MADEDRGEPLDSAPLYFEDVAVGDELPTWSRETGLVHWNRFAAVNDEFYDVHMDDGAARAAENPQGAFGMGMLRFSYLHNLLRGVGGRAGRRARAGLPLPRGQPEGATC